MENRAYMVTDVTKVKESVAKRTAKSLTDPYIALSFHMIDEMERMIQRDVSIKTEQNIFEDLFRKSLKRRNGGVLFYQCLMAGHYLDVITSPPFKSENAKPLALSFEFLLTTLEDILRICRRPDVVSLKTIRSLPDYCALHEDAKRFHYEFINLIKIRSASYFALQWIARETKDKIDVDESLGFLKERASSINTVVESNIAGITELIDEVTGIAKREIKKLKMIILRQLSNQQKEYDEGSTAYVAIENMKKTIIGDGSGEHDTVIDASLNNQTSESKDFLTD